jgi:short-subunit dehydrogenase
MALPPPAADSTALVTGASSGIGRELARQLAERGHGVTLVARRAERLEELAEELRAKHGVRVEVMPTDLTDQTATDRLIDEIAARGLNVEILVNNAGFGIYAPFASNDLQQEYAQLALLIGAVVQLSGRVLPGMLERGRGTIINLSSTAGFQPLPGNADYAACKAFVLMHSEGLHDELRPHGITVTAVCPGPVRTEFQETSAPVFAERLPGFAWIGPERVARDALRAAERGKRSVIPGGTLLSMLFAPNRMIPVALTAPVTKRLMAAELKRGELER